MDRKRIAVIAGTILGTLCLASAAGAANYGLLRSASDDPVPAVGNLDAGTVAGATDTSGSASTLASTAAPSTSEVPIPIPISTVPGSAVTSTDDHGGQRSSGGSGSGGSDRGPSTTVPVTAPSSRATVGSSFQPPAITTDDRSGSGDGSDDHGGDSSSGHGSDDSGSGSDGSGSGSGHPDD